MKTFSKIEKDIDRICHKENLDGEKLTKALTYLLEYFKFDSKVETLNIETTTLEWIWAAGNKTGICSPEVAEEFKETGEWVQNEVSTVMIHIWDGVYQGIGMKIKPELMEKQYSTQIALQSWKIVYLYYWVSFSLLIACSIVFLFLIRRHRADVFDFVSIIIRLIACAVGIVLIALITNEEALYTVLASPALLPLVLVLLCLILFFDKISAMFCNWRLKKSGEPYALEYHDEHHGHGGDHGDHGHDIGHDPLVPDHRANISKRKSAAWSVHGVDEDDDSIPLTHNRSTSYSTSREVGENAYVMSPMLSPPPLTPTPPSYHTPPPGGYAPIGTGQNYGA